MSRESRAFTLIELLIVISIISILTAVATASYTSVRASSRDGVRKSDIRQIQSALELYRADQGYYPTQGGYDGVSCGGSLSYTNGSGVTNTYLRVMPCDPQTSQKYQYSANNGAGCDNSSTFCRTYTLVGCLENSNDSGKDSTTSSSCSTAASITLNNP